MSGFEYDCSICNNTGFVQGYYDEEEVFHMFDDNTKTFKYSPITRYCKCYKYRQNIKRLKRSGLYDFVNKLNFDSFNDKERWQKNMKERAIAYATNPNDWFFIGGQVGAGKTHLCTAICRELLLKGKTVIYVPWREESTKLKAIINESEYFKKVDTLKNAEVLYIDDLFKGGMLNATTGKTQPTQADLNLAFEVLDYRYKNCLPTIISGEKSIDEVINIDEGVGSRIYQRTKENAYNLSHDDKKNYRLYS